MDDNFPKASDYVKREKMVATMLAGGFSESDAHLITDVALHAVDNAMASFQNTMMMIEPGLVGIQATTMGLQMLGSLTEIHLNVLVAMAATHGVAVKVQNEDGSTVDWASGLTPH